MEDIQTNADRNDRVLVEAVTSGDGQAVHNIIQQAIDKSVTFSQWALDHCLLAACNAGWKLTVQYLIKAGASLNAADDHGNTPLILSALKGFSGIANVLITSRADVNTSNGESYTPLHVSAMNRCHEITRMLLDAKADVNATTVSGDTALILSFPNHGSSHVVKLLLDQPGIDVNHRNNSGHTALMRAVEEHDLDIVKMLLDAGACLDNTSPPVGLSPLQASGPVQSTPETAQSIADRLGLGDIIKLLKDHGEDPGNSLRRAVFQRNLDAVKFLVDCQFNTFNETTSSDDCHLLSSFLKSILDKRCAISDIEIKIVTKLLEAGGNINQEDGDEVSPISIATSIGNVSVVELLCKNGARITRKAVVTAASKGSADIMKMFIHFKAELNYRTRNGVHQFIGSALEAALEHGRVECVRILLSNHAYLDIKSALRTCVRHQQMKSIVLLLERYSSPCRDAITSPTSDLLHIAAETGNKDVINFLLDLGADVNLVSGGMIPLVKAGNFSVFRLLIQRGANVMFEFTDSPLQPTALFQILTPGYLELVKRCLRLKGSNVCDDVSCYIYRDECARALLENGSAPDALNALGQSPLMVAAQKVGTKVVIRLLLEAGAQVERVDHKGRSSLYLAVKEGRKENAEVLIQHGCDINLRCHKTEKTAVHVAVDSLDTAMLNLLIENGADLNMADCEGDTPLIRLLSTTLHMSPMIHILLRAQGDVNHHNNKGYTALMTATRKMNKQAMKALIEAGANVNVQTLDDSRKSALSLALDKVLHFPDRVCKCVKLLFKHDANVLCVPAVSIHHLIAVGKEAYAQKLIALGLGPADVEIKRKIKGWYSSKERVSPLGVALLLGKYELVRFFLKHSYLTISDISLISGNKKVIRYLTRAAYYKCLELLKETSSTPLSLETLSFISVSSFIGPENDRRQRAERTQLPKLFQDKLLFRGEEVTSVQLDNEGADDPGLIMILQKNQNRGDDFTEGDHFLLGMFHDMSSSEESSDSDFI